MVQAVLSTYGYSGDPIIFSGTRISIIYPKFLANVWATGYANNPTDAAISARNNLIATLSSAGYTVNPTLIRNTTLIHRGCAECHSSKIRFMDAIGN